MFKDTNQEMTQLVNSIVRHSIKDVEWDDLVKASRLIRTLKNKGGKLNRTRIMQTINIRSKELDAVVMMLEKHKIIKVDIVRTKGRAFEYLVLKG